MKICNFFSDYFAEIFAGSVFLILSASAILGVIGFQIQEIVSFASVTLQVLATYVGLILTAYTVFHGMKINGNDFLKEKLAALKESEKKEAEGLLDDLHSVYRTNIILLSTATIITGIIYFLSMISFGKFKLYMQCDFPEQANACIASFLLGILILSTLHMVSAVTTLFELRRL